ncbi:MAG: hypothetical protein E5X51_24925 [Mesorhizobium sp.]|uniref:hypothetical protein n=1 Tax=Mesorhizobium sp. TaxID=1871066 RepID=UPI0012051FC1|nr:hypothetical protein [Mesorhizobium sp.]TIQ18556.1 MAG: hypothetical protein E5X51_24925 [Mesorhizobium sp.]
MQNMLVIDPDALRLRGTGFVGMRRHFCRILGPLKMAHELLFDNLAGRLQGGWHAGAVQVR